VTSALWANLFGASYEALQYLSLASHLLLCVANYAFARRHVGEPRAVLFGLLLAFSPLLMGISRLALTDSFNALCMTTTVWLFVELSKDPGRIRRGIPFMCALAFMVLVKELSVLLVVPFLAFLAYEHFVRKEPRDPLRFAVWFAVPGLVVLAGFVLAAGSVSKLLTTMNIVIHSPATNTYAIQVRLGPMVPADRRLPALLAGSDAAGDRLARRDPPALARRGLRPDERPPRLPGLPARPRVQLLTKNIRLRRRARAAAAPLRHLHGRRAREPCARLEDSARRAAVRPRPVLDRLPDFDTMWVQNHLYDR